MASTPDNPLLGEEGGFKIFFKMAKKKRFLLGFLYYVPIGSEKIRRLYSFLLLSCFCSQIWLYHLMDDCNSCHIINLRGEKKRNISYN
jgi:hypothetical protein